VEGLGERLLLLRPRQLLYCLGYLGVLGPSEPVERLGAYIGGAVVIATAVLPPRIL
jgi:hypothetical protein